MRRLFGILALVGLLAEPAHAQHASPATGLSLAAAISSALAHNVDLAGDRLALEEARLDLQAIQDGFGPTLDLGSGGGDAIERLHPLGGPSPAQNQGTATLGLSQTLPVGFKYSLGLGTTANQTVPLSPSWTPALTLSVIQPLLRGLGSGGEDLDQQALSLAESRLTLEDQLLFTAASVADAYWDLVAQRETVAVLDRSLSAANALVDANQAKVKAGLASQIDVVQAQVNARRKEAQVLDARRQLDNAADSLRLLIDPDATGSPEPSDAPVYVAHPVSVGDALAIASRRRPDYRSALLRVEADRLTAEKADRQALPDVSVVANGAVQQTGPALVPAAESLPKLADYSWNVGVTLDLPITRSSAVDHAQRARIVERQAQLQAQSARQKLESAIKQAVGNLESGAKQVEIDKVAEDLANQQLDAEEQKLNLGLSSNFQVITYQNDRDAASLAAIEAEVTALKAEVELERLEGTLLEGIAAP